MARRQASAPEGGVLRSASSAVTFWVAVVMVAIVVIVPAVRGDWPMLGFMAPLGAFLIWATWLVLMRPQVRFNADGVEVTNIGRIHTLPWGRVAAVRQGVNLVFALKDGTRIQAWGVSYPRQRSALAASLQREPSIPQRDLDRYTAPLEQLRLEAAPSDAQATRRWDLRPLIIGLALLVILVMAIVVPFAAGVTVPGPGSRVG